VAETEPSKTFQRVTFLLLELTEPEIQAVELVVAVLSAQVLDTTVVAVLLFLNSLPISQLLSVLDLQR
jgi:hypothetical protein